MESDFESKIIELGGEKQYQTHRFFNNNSLIIANIAEPYDEYIDVTNIPFENNDVANYILITMLQNAAKPVEAINEVKKTSRPSG